MTNRRKFVSQLMGAGVALPAFRTDSLSTIFRATPTRMRRGLC